MLELKEIIRELEQLAPPSLQESYDNSGLITGHPGMQITAALICLDSTEEVIDEAIAKGCNLVIAHHPIIFSGLKKINGNTYIERVIIKAIQHHIAIYAIHTNLDNVAHGVNNKIAEKLGLIEAKILSPKKQQLRKMVTFAPIAAVEKVKNSLFEAGAGNIGNYSECSFTSIGQGTFKGGVNSNAFIGKKGERHHEAEERIEVIYPIFGESKLINALKNSHPYEEVAYDLYALENRYDEVGAGMYGHLKNEMESDDFLDFLKERMNVSIIRHSKIHKKHIHTVAICGGSGSFLLEDAKRIHADIFITGDYKYHQFFDAENKIIIADIGHFESEQFTINLIGDYLSKKFTTFALRLTETNTNPIYYR